MSDILDMWDFACLGHTTDNFNMCVFRFCVFPGVPQAHQVSPPSQIIHAFVETILGRSGFATDYHSQGQHSWPWHMGRKSQQVQRIRERQVAPCLGLIESLYVNVFRSFWIHCSVLRTWKKNSKKLRKFSHSEPTRWWSTVGRHPKGSWFLCFPIDPTGISQS